MPYRQYAALDVARYFLAKNDPEVGDLISNLKLQKLLYYAQGLAMGARDLPLFSERIEAWTHGPVVPIVYHEFKHYGANAIPAPDGFDLDRIAPLDRALLDDVHGFYGQYSAWKLREMTHEEPPWKAAYGSGNSHITPSALAAFFADEVSEGYRADYREKAGA